jgi:hypothetical protein
MNKQEFDKLWGIESSIDSIFIFFRNITLDTIVSLLSSPLYDGKIAGDFLFNVGHGSSLLLQQKRFDGCLSSEFNFVNNGVIYKLLKNELNPINYLFYLQTILNSKNLHYKEKSKLFENFKSNINVSSYPVQLVKLDEKYCFLPNGINEFTDALIVSNFIWLNKYPKSKIAFENAIEKYSNGVFQRNLLDDLRLSIELLMKETLKNQKSLENQKESIGQYLKSQNVSTEISNMYWTLLDYFSKYQNTYVKHDNLVKKTEIDFIFYLTGIFMNLMAKISNCP